MKLRDMEQREGEAELEGDPGTASMARPTGGLSVEIYHHHV